MLSKILAVTRRFNLHWGTFIIICHECLSSKKRPVLELLKWEAKNLVTFSCFMPFTIVAHKKYEFLKNPRSVRITHAGSWWYYVITQSYLHGVLIVCQKRGIWGWGRPSVRVIKNNRNNSMSFNINDQILEFYLQF